MQNPSFLILPLDPPKAASLFFFFFFFFFESMSNYLAPTGITGVCHHTQLWEALLSFPSPHFCVF
jgi:hypothetical protein